MRLEEPLWLVLGSAAIGAEQVSRAVPVRRAPLDLKWTPTRARARGRAVARSLTARGDEFRRRSQESASRHLNGWIDRISGSGPVCRFVDNQLGRTLVPLVDRAVPIVLERLDERSEQVRGILREHGEDLTGELAEGIRERAARADDTAERAARRLIGRRGRTADGEAPSAVPR